MYDYLSVGAEAIAEHYQGNEAGDRKRKYFEVLVSSNQNAAASELRVNSKEYQEGIDLYMKAGVPGRAAGVILEHGIVQPLSLIKNVASALDKKEVFEHAG